MVRIHPDPPTHAGAVAQLGEHLLCKQGVVGSIPSSSTNVGASHPVASEAPESRGKRRSRPLLLVSRTVVVYRLFFNNAEEVKQILLERREGRRKPFVRQREQDGLDCYRPAVPLSSGAAGSANARSLSRSSAQCYGVKRLSACGGCLGDHRRRRTWQPAKSCGELANEH